MSKQKNITVEITGMSCASCAQRIETAIGNTEGVSDLSLTSPQGKPPLRAASLPKRSIKLLRGWV
ncbi:MAG: heavy-metal-associated domain-containing protein [Candidatus Scalindua sp. AMX11]|nr:MAG: heavy-metal-associated domain-containing protein [Candidatus Scalindua sp.]NOG84314.1 heavy-metal-associated domain-containing protein [Planctomycetota bacterium]RZV66413.1 MAG: heavy-metal-associated domain-containing protein [Candidatus Scalindua sp. SCAELEC01]TDE63581.1 MAG: heavy-metal-associated domain-containing protein [Candidatus Scalindua sp. AMX11]